MPAASGHSPTSGSAIAAAGCSACCCDAAATAAAMSPGAPPAACASPSGVLGDPSPSVPGCWAAALSADTLLLEMGAGEGRDSGPGRECCESVLCRRDPPLCCPGGGSGGRPCRPGCGGEGPADAGRLPARPAGETPGSLARRCAAKMLAICVWAAAAPPAECSRSISTWHWSSQCSSDCCSTSDTMVDSRLGPMPCSVSLQGGVAAQQWWAGRQTTPA